MESQVLTQIEESFRVIQKKSPTLPLLGLTLGSGLSSFASNVKSAVRIPYREIPHFSPPTVDGHPGDLVIGTIAKIPVAILTGRIHYYEGHSWEHVVYPTRLLHRLGIKTLILTNAAGGLDKKMRPGSLMSIKDHINLTGGNPLRGPNDSKMGPRFPDMSAAYDTDLLKALHLCAKRAKIPLHSGVYCGVCGPSYETPAEVRYLRKIGGSAVGMSTVAETIAARHLGLRVVGISCITNYGAGLTKNLLTHEEVKASAKAAEKNFTRLLLDFIGQVQMVPSRRS